MTIRPLNLVSHDEIVELARNAAENNVPHHEANVFAPDTSQHATFSHHYWARHRELTEVEV